MITATEVSTQNSNVETSPLQVAISANSESHITATSDAEAVEAEVMVEQHIEPTAIDVGAIEVTETANVEPAESDITEPQIASASITEAVAPPNVDVKSIETVEIPTIIAANLFPHTSRPGSNTIPTTIENLRFLLAYYGIIVRYNVIAKKMIIHIPKCLGGTMDNADNVGMSRIISLANLCGMSSGQVAEFILVIADENQVNPVAEWIRSKLWDGEDRLSAFYDTLETKVEFPKKLKETLMFRWMLSLTAAALMPRGFKCRGVLTLQGQQSMGKGSWVEALVSDLFLREQVVLTGKHLDTANKDDVVTAVTHWIVELGELDSSFKKDIARLKGFLTNSMDKVRRPYARADSEYPRRTVFVATVNDQNFLVDPTGNTRFWTLPLIGLNYQHNIDMQQVFAQLAVEFEKGEQWWLTQEEELLLEVHNKENHRVVSAIRERVEGGIDMDRIGEEGLPAMNPTELLIKLGISNPTNHQARECGAILREMLGEPKKIQGSYKWRIPLKKDDEDTGYSDFDDY